MTYALGWKTDTEVFLAADTAVTHRKKKEVEIEKSSFGDKHVEGPKGTVEERVVKLYLKNGIGITFAGDYHFALEIIKTFYREIGKKVDPHQALKWAIGLHCPVKKNVAIIVGYYKRTGPCLLTYNIHKDHKIRDDEDIAQVGSIPNEYFELTKFWLAQISPKTLSQPRLHLASVLAVLQRYTLIDSLLIRGVGGAFAGLFIDNTGGYWQPDLFLYVDQNDKQKLISTCFRENCFVINSPFVGQSRCFLSYLPPKSNREIREKTSLAKRQGKKLHNEAKFDFLIIFSTNGETITLIQMSKNSKHELIWLEPFSESSGRKGTKIYMFPSLRRIIEDETVFKYISYRKPKIKTVSGYKVVKRKIKY